jgi:ABC-type bacteriocin/lantibiotic exporter with double-glycine peptidase domain
MRKFFGQLRWLFSPRDKKNFVLLSVLMALSALLEMAGLGMLVGAATLFLSPDTPAAQQVNDFLLKALPDISEPGRIIIAVAVIALLLAGKNLFALWIVRKQSKFIAAKQSELAERLFKTYLYAENEAFTRLMPDECFSNITRITTLCSQILLPAVQIFADLLVITALTVTALWLFPWITLLSACFMFISAGSIALLTRKINQHTGKKFMAADLRENRTRHTGIFGKKNINITNSENFFLHRFAGDYREIAGLFGKLYTLGQVPRLALETLAVLTAAGLFCVLLFSGMPKAEILIVFAVLTAAVARMLPALSRCHYNLTLLRQSTPLLDNLISALQNIPQQELAPAGTAADAAGEIILKDVDFAYQDGTRIFTGLNLTFPPYSSTALAGKSGRGKTTLAEILLTLLKIQRGKITAGGVDIYNDIAAWRRQTGYVPQEIFLLEASLRENIAFGIAPETVDEQKIRTVMQLARLEDFTPDQPVSAGTVSGGQRQRIGIARALYRDAKLLIMDEPTSALDAETEQEFCQALRDLHGKVTLIVISHRESTLQCCDRVINL